MKGWWRSPPPLPAVTMPDFSAAFGGPGQRPEVMPDSHAPPTRAGPPYVRDEPEDIVVCECGAAVSWAVYMDHHGSQLSVSGWRLAGPFSLRGGTAQRLRALVSTLAIETSVRWVDPRSGRVLVQQLEGAA